MICIHVSSKPNKAANLDDKIQEFPIGIKLSTSLERLFRRYLGFLWCRWFLPFSKTRIANNVTYVETKMHAFLLDYMFKVYLYIFLCRRKTILICFCSCKLRFGYKHIFTSYIILKPFHGTRGAKNNIGFIYLLVRKSGALFS